MWREEVCLQCRDHFFRLAPFTPIYSECHWYFLKSGGHPSFHRNMAHSYFDSTNNGATFRLRIRSTHPQVRKKRPGTSTGFLWYTLFSQTCHGEAWSLFPSHPMFASLHSLHPHPSYSTFLSIIIHHYPSCSITIPSLSIIIHHYPSLSIIFHHSFSILWLNG